MDRSTITVTVEDGSYNTYVVFEGCEVRPALVVCSEAFGVNEHMRNVADRFAAQGYLVAVPDLLWRIEPGMEIAYDDAGLRRGSEIAEAFDKEKGVEDLRPLLKRLRDRPGCNGRVGILGFCIGGAVAYLASARLNIDACVSYYGKGIEDYLEEADAVTCPAVLHYGGADRFIPPATVEKVRKTLGTKPGVEIYDYPGVDHGFNSEDRRAYTPDVAQLAMERTLRILQRGLHA